MLKKVVGTIACLCMLQNGAVNAVPDTDAQHFRFFVEKHDHLVWQIEHILKTSSVELEDWFEITLTYMKIEKHLSELCYSDTVKTQACQTSLAVANRPLDKHVGQLDDIINQIRQGLLD